MEFKEFEIQSLFYKAKVNSLPYKAKELPKTPNAEFDLPALTAGIENQGLSCYVPRAKATVLSNCISVSANGANTGAMFYQSNDFTVLQDSYALLPIETMSAHAMLYCISAMQYVIRGNYDWSNKAGWERIKTLKITLPTSDGINPDYAYMERYISELEQERISELEKYLSVTGLEDCELTEEDIKTLSGLCGKEGTGCAEASENGEEVKEVAFMEFRVGALFEPLKVGYKGKGQKIGSAMREPSAEYCVPLTCAKTGDNGIMYWGKKNDFITYTNTISIIADGAVSAGLVYAQPEEAGAYSHSYFIRLTDMNVSKQTYMYLACVLNNVIYPKYSRERAPRWGGKVENDMITLPTSDGINPDYDYMDKYIRVMEKLVIKGVVDYKDAVIAETRRQVNP